MINDQLLGIKANDNLMSVFDYITAFGKIVGFKRCFFLHHIISKGHILSIDFFFVVHTLCNVRLIMRLDRRNNNNNGEVSSDQ